jgi:hypothetical protein
MRAVSLWLAAITLFTSFALAGSPVAITTTSLPDGLAGEPYTATLNATGPLAPFTWLVSAGSPFPPGLSLSNDGIITGVPSSAGTFAFTIAATDTSQQSQATQFSITIAPAISIQPRSLPDAALMITTTSLLGGEVGVAYSQSLAATGGTPPYTWSITTGAPPAGLNPSSSGQISGTPMAAGTANFTVKVTDSASASVTQALSINIVAAPVITTSSLPGGEVGVAYAQSLGATGGTPPYTWSTTVGAPPAGLNPSSSGQISGTPTAAGTANFTVKVTDSNSASVTQALSINIVAAPVITTSSLPGGEIGIAYSQSLAASGGSPPYTWSITTGALPAGLNPSSAGQISGTPTAAGTANFTVKVTDSNSASVTQALSINIVAAPVITTTSLPGGEIGTAYLQSLAVSGGTPPYTWSITSGALPTGLNPSSTGQISGTPTVAGTANFTVKVADGNSGSATQALSIVISAALVITTPSLPNGQLGTFYSQSLAATGGVLPYTWSIASGALPAGLMISAAGQISGTPTAAGTANFTVKATDSSSASVTQALSINIVPPLAITTASLPNGQLGAAYSQSLAASGGTSPYTWSITTGALPAGLMISSAGQISGTPTAALTANFTVKVTDSTSASVTQGLSITIVALLITTPSLPAGEVGIAYSQSLASNGGTSPYTWSITTGALPAGLMISSAGQISGTPTAAGTANFTVKVTDSNSVSSTQALSINIVAALMITTASLPGGQVGIGYSQSLASNGGISPYTWSIAAGALPAGLMISSAGQISGTPTAGGTANFTVKVTDSNSSSATQALSINIIAALVITTASLPNGQVGTAYSQTLQASGGTPPYTWSVTSGALPNGLSISSSGQVSGTPTNAGTFSFSATVKDSLSASAVANLGIMIAAGVSISGCPAGTGTVGQVYNASLTAAGGTSPYNWSITGGQLPGGLALDGLHGQISGTPTTPGTSAFTLHVSDSASGSANQNCSITISSAVPPLSVSTVALPDGIAGVQYGQTLSARGGQPPYTWSLGGGALPPGLNVSANGQISGSPATAGQFAFTVHVVDSASGTASKDLSIRIGAALVVTACPAGSGVVGQAYTGTAAAAGGSPPYSWSASGALPPGLALDRTSGTLAGTPSATGPSAYVLVVSDSSAATANKSCSMNVIAALTVTTTILGGGDPSLPYAQQLGASGGTPPYTWSLSSGTLPSGLTLSSFGSITGHPATTGTFTFTVRVTDSSGLFADRPLSIAVVSSISIGCPATNAVGGQPYSSAASATGGQAPYTWSPALGLPSGLSLSASGELTGIPTDIGTFLYTLTVGDKNGASVSQQCTLTVAANLTILTASLPDASQFSQYSQSLNANGGKAPYVWSTVSGALPLGLNLSSAGLLSGSATQLGLFNFTVKVTDGSGASAQKAFAMNVFSGLLVAACPPSVSEIGLLVNVSLAAAGGVQPYKWSVSSGSLPAGLVLDPSAGTISGTPTQSGTAQITLMAADNTNQTATRQCTLDVRPALTITTSSLASNITGAAAYSDTVAASGGQPPYIWSTTAGSLPPGLSLNAGTGQITGKPVAAGTFGFTVQATDNIGAQTTKDLAITIAQGLTIPNCPTPVGVIGQPYSAALVVAGGTSPFQWSLNSGALPSGLSLDASNALIAGVPSQAGSSSYVLQVNDSSNMSATRACTIQINGATLTITSASLPDGVVSAQYSQTLAASGGLAPYSWSIVSTGAPDGFSLDASGALTGTASTAGAFTFTVQVTDQDNNVARQTLTLNIRAGTPPNITIVGLPNIVDPAQQPTFSLQLDSSYPADITGTVTLTFTPDPAVGVDDPAVQFATGGRVLQFSLPANSKNPVFSAPILALQTGTVAGTIQLAVSIQSVGTDITPATAQVLTIRLDRLAPKIVSLTAVPTTSGVELHIIAFATTRQVTQGVFQFQPTSGAQPVSVTVPLTDSGTAWFQSAQSMQFGGEFSLVQPFTFQGQSLSNFSSVSVTLSNAQGNSDPMSVKF